MRQALRDAQARRGEPDLAALDAEITGFLDQTAVAEGVGAKLNRLLLGFLQTEVLPEARRESDHGVDPTPLFALVIRVLRKYADAIQRTEGTGH